MIGYVETTIYGTGRVLATIAYTPVRPDEMTPREQHEDRRDKRDLRKLLNRLPRVPAGCLK